MHERSEAEIGSLRLQLVENLREAETEIASLKAQLTANKAHAQDEIAALKAQIDQRDRLAEIDRRVFTEEAELRAARRLARVRVPLTVLAISLNTSTESHIFREYSSF